MFYPHEDIRMDPNTQQPVTDGTTTPTTQTNKQGDQTIIA